MVHDGSEVSCFLFFFFRDDNRAGGFKYEMSFAEKIEIEQLTSYSRACIDAWLQVVQYSIRETRFTSMQNNYHWTYVHMAFALDRSIDLRKIRPCLAPPSEIYTLSHRIFRHMEY
jgi:hypothetical protein